ncbi:MAG: trypsin-like serine peptidase, partial [bacterium]
MKKILFLFTCYSFYLSVLAQSPHDKIPASFKEDETLSPLPVVKIKINEMRLKSQECVHDNKMKPFQFAIPVRLDFTPNNSGIWDTLKTGEKIWRLSLESPGAYSLNVIFGEYMLNDGAHLYIYNAEKNVVRGAFTGLSNKSPGILPVSPVPGDKLIVELNIPPGLEEYGALRLTQVAHDYKNIFKIMGNKSDQVEAGACNINIACPPGDPWQNEKRAVCRMIINGFETCSGTLVNNTSFNANPYILTANHCINSSSRASKTIFYFNYESKDCNNGEGNLNNSISGSSLLATKYSLDFSLVQLSSKIPQSFRPYFAGWNAKDSPIPTSTVTIHHPQGDVKKITIDTDAPAISSYPYDPGLDKDAFLRIFDWEAGTTEGGSSGAALFDQNHRVIGGLTGGDADCINPINDYFFRFNTAWDKYNIFESTYLETWLDPINTGLLVLDGFDPYSQVAPNCELVGNIDTEEEILLYNHEGTWGYWTGHNSDSITTYAEKFIKKETDTISG